VVVNNNAVPVLIQLIASPKDYVREQVSILLRVDMRILVTDSQI